jgi:hypothetical protein
MLESRLHGELLRLDFAAAGLGKRRHFLKSSDEPSRLKTIFTQITICT